MSQIQIKLYAHYLSAMPQANYTSELLCLCNAYSAEERNIIERIIQSGFVF